MTLRSAANTSMRAWRRYFPLVSVESVVGLFEEMLQINQNMESISPSTTLEPNLAFASIILGYIESHITRDSSTLSSDVSFPSSSRKRPSSNSLRSSRASKRLTVRLSSPATSFAEVPSPDTLLPIQEDDAASTSMPPSDCAPSPVSVTTEPSKPVFPTLRFEDAEQLYQRFYEMIAHDPQLVSMARIPVDSTTTTPSKRVIPQSSNRGLIKAVCDALCSNMASSLRIRERIGHAQSVYSLLTFGQLDSFGLAYSTVAACQLLGYSDVHLALSEDHAWVEFGPPERRENADVSVMPGLELLCSQASSVDNIASATLLRPPPVRLEPFLHSWLYLNGCPVVCNPGVLSIAAAVAAIQPSQMIRSSHPLDSIGRETSPSNSRRSKSKMSSAMSTSSDGHSTRTVEGISTERDQTSFNRLDFSFKLLQLKQRLLWTVYRAGLLDRYPLGLTNLAEIEAGFPSSGIQVADIASDLHAAPDCVLPEIVEVFGEGVAKEADFQPDVPLELLRRAVEIDRVFFRNQHVYPYLYLANYHRRRGDAIGALHYWAEAARVIGQYNHSTEDVEIYREFLEIATTVIPEFFRSRSGDTTALNLLGRKIWIILLSGTFLDSPLCMAYLIAFYDHLCLWEEGSAVPVLHVGWVDKLVASLVRFPPSVRTQLHIKATRANDDKKTTGSVALATQKSRCRPSATVNATSLRSGRAEDVTDDSKTVMDVKTTQQPLRVILPPPIASSGGLQSSSTTGSSILSMFPSGGEISSSTIPETMSRLVSRSVADSDSSRLPSGLIDEDEDNPLDVNRLLLEHAAGAIDKVIARLTRASQYRLLNPRFLMGAKDESPFASGDDLREFFISTESDNSRISSEIPGVQEVKVLEENTTNNGNGDVKIKDEDRADEGVEDHPEPREMDVGNGEDLGIGIEIPLRHLHRVSPSPESSICPSLPSIASTPPLPLHQQPLTVNMTTGDDLETDRSVNDASEGPTALEAYMHRSVSQTEPPAETDIEMKSEPAVEDSKPSGVHLNLYSAKMCRISHLLNAPGSLKTSAIKLTLTAQSEVDVGRGRRCRRASTSSGWNRLPDCAAAPATE
ncbi:hypothetical protein Aperf_G00000017673 [Anoplocephala perfoliata]